MSADKKEKGIPRKRTRGAVDEDEKLLVSTLSQDFIEAHDPLFIESCKYILSKDPTLFEVMTSSNFMNFATDSLGYDLSDKDKSMEGFFTQLTSVILSQQISGKAAESIKAKYRALFNDTNPKISVVYDKFHTEGSDLFKKDIRSIGFSGRKLAYFESLSDYFYEKRADIEKLFFDERTTDDQIIEELVSNIKGIGPWSAKMFLATYLKRPNVFAADDLGVARGCSLYFETRPEVLKDLTSKRTLKVKSKFNKGKRPTFKVYDHDLVESCGELFAPHKTAFMFMLWRISSTRVEAMTNQNNKK